MRVTVNIPDELIAEVQKIVDEKSQTRAIIIAMEAFVKQNKLKELRRLRGKITLDYDWQKQEKCELKAYEKRNRACG